MEFYFSADEKDVKREKAKARELRKSQWWKRKCDKGRCHYCQAEVTPTELTMDHVVPLARGGKSTKGNLVTACKECNTKKKQMLPMEWDAYMDRLGTQPD